MSRPSFEAMQAQILETAERETGHRHIWIFTPHDSLWTLKDLGETVQGWVDAANDHGGVYAAQ